MAWVILAVKIEPGTEHVTHVRWHEIDQQLREVQPERDSPAAEVVRMINQGEVVEAYPPRPKPGATPNAGPRVRVEKGQHGVQTIAAGPDHFGTTLLNMPRF